MGKNRNRNRRRNQKKAEANQKKAAQPEQTFACGVCLDDCPLRHKMPASSLGCSPCSGEICTNCFCEDLKHRRMPYYVSDEGFEQWDDIHELAKYITGRYEQEYDPDDFPAATLHGVSGRPVLSEHFLAFMKTYMFKGKQCPFCRSHCLWHLDEIPHLDETTGKFTFTPPRYVFPQPLPTNLED